MPKFKTLVEFW